MAALEMPVAVAAVDMGREAPGGPVAAVVRQRPREWLRALRWFDVRRWSAADRSWAVRGMSPTRWPAKTPTG